MRRMLSVTLCVVLLSSVSVQSGVALQQGRGEAKQQQSTQQQAKPQQAKQQQQSGKQKERAQAERGKAQAAQRGNKESAGKQRAAAQQKQAPAEERARGKSEDRSFAKPGRGRLTPEDVSARMRDLPEDVRRLGNSARVVDRVAVNAVARGVARGLPADEVTMRVIGDHVRVRNRKGDVLLDMSEERARELGAWDMRLLGDRRATGNAPSFCRSGAGHPQWGRQWCLDKGFGLGSDNDAMLWSRSDVRDVIFSRRTDRDRLERPDLLDVVGDIVFGRLALHALTLGFTEPLVGLWTAQPNAPQLLRVQSGGVDVAELADLDRDNRVDVLFVTQYR